MMAASRRCPHRRRSEPPPSATSSATGAAKRPVEPCLSCCCCCCCCCCCSPALRRFLLGRSAFGGRVGPNGRPAARFSAAETERSDRPNGATPRVAATVAPDSRRRGAAGTKDRFVSRYPGGRSVDSPSVAVWRLICGFQVSGFVFLCFVSFTDSLRRNSVIELVFPSSRLLNK